MPPTHRFHIAMARAHHPTKLAAERKFPLRVDIPVPAAGFGNRLNEMEAWYRANFHADQWCIIAIGRRSRARLPRTLRGSTSCAARMPNCSAGGGAWTPDAPRRQSIRGRSEHLETVQMLG